MRTALGSLDGFDTGVHVNLTERLASAERRQRADLLQCREIPDEAIGLFQRVPVRARAMAESDFDVVIWEQPKV